jgi:prephenate dehydrogenase
MVKELAPHCDVLVSDPATTIEQVVASGGRLGPFSKVAACSVVILSVPVQNLEGVLMGMLPHMRSDALVVDVSSVKVQPAEMMQRLLPESCEILATHPLFGPQSGAQGIAGLPIVVWPLRISESSFETVQKFLKITLGLDMRIISPDEHDKEMAYIQALTFFLGKALGEMGLPDTPIKTKTYQHLLDVLRIVGGDSAELFATIQTYNPYAPEVRKELIKRLIEVDRKLDEK